MNVIDVVVLFAYASLLLELVVFPIPSEASTWQLLAPNESTAGGELARVQQLPLPRKLLLYALPTAVGVALFLIPLACIVFPAVRPSLLVAPQPIAALVGAVVIVAGRVVTFTSVLHLRRSRAAGAAAMPGGWFRWSRNPGLVGMFVFYAGLALVCLTPVLWLGLPLYFGNMHRRVRIEEAHLGARLGAAWGAYSARVPRYLPLPGLR
jgi:protein-S-isoprenylcysteine O-methyltransferase Ste14